MMLNLQDEVGRFLEISTETGLVELTNPLETGNTLLYGGRFGTAKYIIQHVVSRKHVLVIINSEAFTSEFLENLENVSSLPISKWL